MPENKEIVIQFQMDVAKKLRGEQMNLHNYLADDAQWHLPGSLDTLCDGSDKIGRDAVIDMIENLVSRFYKTETMAFKFHSMIQDGDFVHMHFTLKAETINGKAYCSGYQTLFKVVNGKIAEVWEYFDSARILHLLNE